MQNLSFDDTEEVPFFSFFTLGQEERCHLDVRKLLKFSSGTMLTV